MQNILWENVLKSVRNYMDMTENKGYVKNQKSQNWQMSYF